MRSLQHKFCRHGSHITIDDEDDGDGGSGSGREACPGLVAFFFDASSSGLVDLFSSSSAIEKHPIESPLCLYSCLPWDWNEGLRNEFKNGNVWRKLFNESIYIHMEGVREKLLESLSYSRKLSIFWKNAAILYLWSHMLTFHILGWIHTV